MELNANGYLVRIDPEHGGQVRELSFQGKPVFRTAKHSADPLQSSCFSLAPYSNRIKDAQFQFAGEQHRLEINWDGDEHSIHGEGWQTAWSVLEKSTRSCIMSFVGGSNWPWPYYVEQSIRIDHDGVEFRLSLYNDGRESFPVGAGFHPYFPKFDDTKLQFNTLALLESGVWNCKSLVQPPHDLDFQNGHRVSSVDIDACYAGWDRNASVKQPSLGLEIEIATTSSTEWCTLYIPRNEDFFCFEPVSHATGAFNRSSIPADGLHLLRPGEQFTFDMKVSARDTNLLGQ